MAENLVLTPGGYRPPALVHLVEPGQTVRMTDGQMRLVNLVTKASIDIPRTIVPPEDVPSLGSGWIAFAYWNNNTGIPISSFRAIWQVPPPPATQANQTIFLFNGIDPSNPSSGILQPVLQWGSSAAGGGPHWSVASWYLTADGHAFHTLPVQVDVGDTLVGVMTLTGQSGNLFSYNCAFQGIAGTTLTVQNIEELVWCNVTLEAYLINQGSDYPATDSSALRSIDIQTGDVNPTLDWTPVNKVTDCGQHTVVVSNSATEGEVDIFYRAKKIRIPLDDLAEYVQLLFGVTNDGGGFLVLPNGQIIHILPDGPSNPLFREIAGCVTELARGLSVREISLGSINIPAREAMRRASLEMMTTALEEALQTVRMELAEPSDG